MKDTSATELLFSPSSPSQRRPTIYGWVKPFLDRFYLSYAMNKEVSISFLSTKKIPFLFFNKEVSISCLSTKKVTNADEKKLLVPLGT